MDEGKIKDAESAYNHAVSLIPSLGRDPWVRVLLIVATRNLRKDCSHLENATENMLDIHIKR